MANLRSDATLTDLTSPEGKAAFRDFIKIARTRRAGDVKALHVLRLDPGIYCSLDLGFWAFDLDALMAEVSAAMLKMQPDDVIPLHPVGEWWKFWTAPIIKGYMGYHCPVLRSSRVFLTVRGGEWPK